MTISIHCVTLNRSDYASSMPVFQALLADSRFSPYIIAGGSHCLAEFGNSLAQMTQNGIQPDKVIDFLAADDLDNREGIAGAYARAVTHFAGLWTENRPNMVFLLGDRWEMQAVATVCAMLQIPIAHHSGGDITEGSSDNQTRYLLSTLAHLHFTAMEEHRQRLLHMGEEPWRVVTVGEPALTLLEEKTRDEAAFRQFAGLAEGQDFVLATFHPASYDQGSAETQITLFLDILSDIPHQILLTGSNSDMHGGMFQRRIDAFAAAAGGRCHVIKNMGGGYYYAAMKHARYMIGNSSSGLWEAPSFALPVVNIGDRQAGRTAGPNVIHAPLSKAAIEAAIRQADSEPFRAGLDHRQNPYAKEDCLEVMLDMMARHCENPALLTKKFIDPLAMPGAHAGETL